MTLTKFKFDWTCTNTKVKVEFFKNVVQILYHFFVPFGTKISKKNNLKQKSYKDFSFLKICKCVNPHKT